MRWRNGSRTLAALLLLASSGILAASAPARASTAAPAAKAGETVRRYSGEAAIGTEPPLPVHLETRQSGSSVTGIISTHGGNFDIAGTAVGDLLEGKLSGGGAEGRVTLRFSSAGGEGSFDLGGQKGTMKLTATDKDAAAFLKGPEQKTDLTTAQWHQDLDRLVEILIKEHGSPFHRTSKAAFSKEVERVRAAIPKLPGREVAIELRKLGALIGDGHTSVALLTGQPRFPLQTYWFEDGLHVVRVAADRKDLLGAELVAIDGVPITRIVKRLRDFIGQGETEWAYRSSLPLLLTRTDLLDAIAAQRKASRDFTFKTPNGKRRTVLLNATTETVSWERLGSGVPLWQRHPEKSFWFERWSENAVYVNWRSYDDLAVKGQALLQDLDRQRPDKLIVDLRDSGGGDFNVGRAFIAEIQKRPWLNKRGLLFVLVGRSTFSAAMTNVVDFMKGTQARIVGEPAGAAPNNWQEVRSFHLPNSGLSVSVSTKYYEFLPGASAVRPEISIPPQRGDWGRPRDRAVDYVLKLS